MGILGGWHGDMGAPGGDEGVTDPCWGPGDSDAWVGRSGGGNGGKVEQAG